MLTSSNQYLRPEYLTPLPTTLDAKKSPLALLAQTCSQIGADAPNSKLLQSAEKSKKESSSSKEKSSSSESHKPTFKPYDNTPSTREKSKSPEERASSASNHRVRTPITSASKSASARCPSNQSATSPRASPSVSERKTPAETNGHNEETSTPNKTSERASTSPQTPSSSSGKSAYSSSILTSQSTDPAIKDMPLGTFKPGSVPVSSPFLGAYPPLPMDLMTSSLLSHHAAMKSGGLSPYLSYARLKGPGSESMVPVCRDPYCTGCSLSSHLLTHGGAPKTPTSCPAGCSQCDHATSKSSAASYMGHGHVAAAYAHAQLAALAAASHLPYVCNWIAGDAAYCGKRFSSSEELLQHLRTHTSVGSDATSALSMLSAPGLPPTHPLLHRTYPTPPLSPLATARYHPYSKPSLLPPSLTSSPLTSFSLGHPGLPPYMSPYSIYGPRLGAAPGMHP